MDDMGGERPESTLAKHKSFARVAVSYVCVVVPQ